MIKQSYTIDDANSKNLICLALDFLDSNLFLREFAKEYCDFSHVTLRSRLVNTLPLLDEVLSAEVSTKLNSRKGKSVHEDIKAQERILRAVSMLLNDNLTIEEIAQVEGTTIMTIYRDLTKRLHQMKGISPEIEKAVLLKLKEHSLENLIPKGSSR